MKPLIKWGWVRALLFFTAIIIFNIFVSKFKNLILPQHFKLYEVAALYYHLIKLCGTLMILFLFMKYVDRKPIMSLGFDFKAPFCYDMLLGVGTGFLGIVIVFLILLFSGSIEVTGIKFPIADLLLITAVFLVGVIREEIISRGYVLTGFMGSMNKYVALLAVSCFFALLHADNPNLSIVGLINIFIGGLFLGIYYIHKKNLWFPIGLHFGWNFTLGSIVGSPVSGYKIPAVFNYEIGGSELLTGGKFGFEGSIITSIFLLSLTILIHLKYNKLK